MLYQNYKAPVFLILIAAGVINFESYGVYPYSDNHLDERDMIYKQEWDEIIDVLGEGDIATSNARDLLFYMDLESEADRSKEGLNEIFETDNMTVVQINDVDDISNLLSDYNITYIIFQKIEVDEVFIDYMATHNTNYSVFRDFEYSIIYIRD